MKERVNFTKQQNFRLKASTGCQNEGGRIVESVLAREENIGKMTNIFTFSTMFLKVVFLTVMKWKTCYMYK